MRPLNFRHGMAAGSPVAGWLAAGRAAAGEGRVAVGLVLECCIVILPGSQRVYSRSSIFARGIARGDANYAHFEPRLSMLSLSLRMRRRSW